MRKGIEVTFVVVQRLGGVVIGLNVQKEIVDERQVVHIDILYQRGVPSYVTNN